MKAAREPAGFTLIEITAVLMLIALLAVVCLPVVTRGNEGLQIRLCRDQLWRDARTARAEAVANRREAGLVFGAAAYRLDRGCGEAIQRRLPAGFTLAAEPPAADRLTFGPDGTCAGARLILNDGRRDHRLRVGEDGGLAWE